MFRIRVVGLSAGGVCRVLGCSTQVPSCGFKNYVLPPTYYGVEYPERNKLKFMEKVPQYPSGLRPPKMQKKLYFMRGPELIHTSLIHQQYGIVALGPGRLRSGHFEMMRLTIGRKMDVDKMFAIWRVDAPWQPVTKKSQGKRMGGGKGAIDHYVTPIKHGRIIVEMGGHCEFQEVFPVLREVAEKLPFPAKPVTHKMLEEMKQKEIEEKENNINPYPVEYLIKNNMGMCQYWISPNDRRWFFKHR